MKKIGFLVNPIAGMGGAVGLKGTDGKDVLEKARELGAEPISPARAGLFFTALTKRLQLARSAGRNTGGAAGIRDLNDIHFIAAGGSMGEEILREALPLSDDNPELTTVIHGPGSGDGERTTSDDTRDICRAFVENEVDLIIFCGGDGTTRDIFEVVGDSIPVLGIPAGVKMHSALFAVDPGAAAALFVDWLNGDCGLMDAEVMDIDEEAYRRGEMKVKLYGYAKTPFEKQFIQGMKSVYQSVDDEAAKEDIARYVKELMDAESDTLFIVGPGTTTRMIAGQYGIEKTLLGVDLIRNGKLVAADVAEKEIMDYLDDSNTSAATAKIMVSVIGNQGFVLGRGNQQISARVIRKVGTGNIIIVASPNKIYEIRVLRVDTGDHELDAELSGYVRVITGYHQMRMTRIEITE